MRYEFRLCGICHRFLCLLTMPRTDLERCEWDSEPYCEHLGKTTQNDYEKGYKDKIIKRNFDEPTKHKKQKMGNV